MPFDLDAYLARIGHRGPVAHTVATLEALHEAHAAAIPFENIDVLMGRSLDLSLDGVADKLVVRHRGGYCYEHALLLHGAFAAMGFRATLLAARVRMGYAAPRPRTHALLAVEAKGRRWIADAGFGLLGLLVPLPLVEGARVDPPLASFRLGREGRDWLMQARLKGEEWQDLYAFSEEPQAPVDYVMANHFTSTWPDSPFIRSLVAARVTRDSRTVLIDRNLTTTTMAGTETRTLADADDLGRTLEQVFRLEEGSSEALAEKVFASAP
ncbi:MAG: arylamine N-acetyltransferase [Acetobacterales bacterium]